MPITIYNTLNRSLQEFKPLQEGRITMYMCGPTVYNLFHIGNARTFVMGDIIRRYFQYRTYDVRFVMNITDVDDKIIQQAGVDGVDATTVAEKYTEAFLSDIERLGIRRADAYPRATGHMGDIIDHIAALERAGSAYAVDGDVFFRVSAFKEYGKLSGKRLDDLIAGARVEADARKENPADFALWKKAKAGEPSWDSPWGRGRPGWHIECSVMSQKELGVTFDIHAGGNDLIFPHHENEIAQSEALSGQPLANYWLHFGFLNIDNEKMSKSLGNFFTAREVLERYDASTIRFFLLQTHYRSPLNFSSEGLDAARTGLKKLHGLHEELQTGSAGRGILDVVPFRQRFTEAMDEDFNTPAGSAVLFDLVREANAALRSETGLDEPNRNAITQFLEETAGSVFGILDREKRAAGGEEMEGLLRILIDARSMAKKEKQYALSDFIREELRKLGIALEDGKTGTTWKWM